VRHLDNSHGGGFLTRAVIAWGLFVFRHPRKVLLVLAVLLAASGVAATTLRIDTDSSRMLSEKLPFQVHTRELAEAFPVTKRAILILVRSTHHDAADAATRALVDGLRGRGSRGDDTDGGIARVFAGAVDPFFRRNGLLYLDIEALETRLTRLSESANLMAELRENRTLGGFETALARTLTLVEGAAVDPAELAPFLDETAEVIESHLAGRARPLDWQGAFSARTGAEPVLRVITVEPELDFSRLSPAKPAIEAVRAGIAAIDPDLAALVEIGVTGDPVLRAEELDSVSERLGLSLFLSLLLVAMVLLLTFRRPTRVLAALASLTVTLVLTVGFTALAVGTLNLISIAFVVLMVGLGIDFAIHYLSHLEEAAAEGIDAGEAVARSGGEIGAALFLSALTTSVAFLAFTATDFVGMAQLGLIGGVGVLIAFLVAVTVIPALTALVPGLLRGRAGPALPTSPRNVGRWAIAAAGLLAAVSLWYAPQVRFDADPMGLRDPAAPSVVAYGWLRADAARAPERMGYIAADAERAAAVADRLAGVETVAEAVWLGDLVPERQDEKLALIDIAWPSMAFIVDGEASALAEASTEALPDRLRALGGAAGRRLAASLDRLRQTPPDGTRDLERALFRFLPDLIARVSDQMAVDVVTVADLPPALVDRYRAAEGRYLVEIRPTEDIGHPEARGRFVTAVNAVLPEAAGPPAQIHGAVDAVSRAMLLAAGLALAGTLVLAGLVLRRAALVAAIVFPLLLAALVTLGASVALGLPFNFANIIVLPLMIGIGVDSGIHLALRTVRARTAVFDTSTPRAVLASALTTVAAFGTLALSDHVGTASMGIMLAIAMVASVAMIFAFTPLLVRLFMRRHG